MTTWNKVQGDVGDTLIARLMEASVGPTEDPTPMDLTSVTLVEPYVVWPKNKVESRVFLPGSVYTNVGAGITPVEGLVLVQLSPWLETAEVGTWWLRYRLSSSGKKITWPDGKADRISVWAEGDPLT
jgi:hypothetical protein